MKDFEKHKENFFSFLNSIKESDKKVGIISHANCVDGLASAVFIVEILKKKFHWMDLDISFISYTPGALDKLAEKYIEENISKVFVLDLNVDVSLFEEFENFRKKLDVLFIDHHPLSDKLIIDEKIIKTLSHDCTALTLFRFGKGDIDYSKWSWLVCVVAVSEFSWKNKSNLNFIQKYYPEFTIENKENSDLLKLVSKLNSLVTFYSKDSLKAYEIILNNNFDKIDEIHKDVDIEMKRCLKDFENNAEKHFNGKLYFYFFNSKFSFGSKLSTILSLKHKDSIILVFSEIFGTNLIKVSARNNSDKMICAMNDMLRAGVSGLGNALSGGHTRASAGTFLRENIDDFKRQILNYINSLV